VIESHGNAKSRGAGGPAEKDLERHRLKIDPRRSKNNKSLISLTMKVSLKRLMIRNPKDFGVWSACPSGVHSVITKLEMLPYSGLTSFFNFGIRADELDFCEAVE